MVQFQIFKLINKRLIKQKEIFCFVFFLFSEIKSDSKLFSPKNSDFRTVPNQSNINDNRYQMDSSEISQKYESKVRVHCGSKVLCLDKPSLNTETLIRHQEELKQLMNPGNSFCQLHTNLKISGGHQSSSNNKNLDTSNKELKETCKRFNIPFNVKSHSFRVNMITNLLKVTSVQHTANIIGHQDIRSTIKYNRYAMSKTEIQNLLD